MIFFDMLLMLFGWTTYQDLGSLEPQAGQGTTQDIGPLLDPHG